MRKKSKWRLRNLPRGAWGELVTCPNKHMVPARLVGHESLRDSGHPRSGSSLWMGPNRTSSKILQVGKIRLSHES